MKTSAAFNCGSKLHHSEQQGSGLHLGFRAINQALLLVVMTMLWATSAVAQDVANTAAGYVGTATGNWSGGGSDVVGIPNDSCSNMGSQGKANFISNFGFNIPGTATITGITAFSKLGSANPETVTFQLASDVGGPVFIGTTQDVNIPGGAGGSCGTTIPGQYPATTNNNLADWGLVSLTPGTVSQASFGLGLTTASKGTVKFDSVCLQIAYTTAAGPAVTQSCLTAPPAGANIQVVKTVVGTPPGTDWAFNITGPAALNQNFNLAAAGASQPFASVTAGSYTITETTKAGYTVAAQCTVNEVPLADSNAADNIVTITVADNQNVACAFVNTLNSATFTVYKDFSDDNAAVVTVNLSCESGTTVANDLFASEASPAVFTVNGAVGTPNCVATETNVPAGYTPNNVNCAAVPLGSGSCTITNTLNVDSFTVIKDFSDNATDEVDIALSCASGTVTISPLKASEGNPAVFEVVGANGDPVCVATESNVPAGYTSDNSGCDDIALSLGTCTITNTLNSADFVVAKTYNDGNTTPVSVTLGCGSGTVINSPQMAAPGNPAVFTVTGYNGDPNCTANETVPVGYVADTSNCASVPLEATGQCTIANTARTTTFTVSKSYSDGVTTDSVTINLDCTSGTIAANDLSADPSTPAVFTVTTFDPNANPTCTATESGSPDGWTPDESDCLDSPLVNGSCTIANVLNSAQFTVNKTYDDANMNPVSVGLVCDSGTPTVSPKDAAPGAPAVFDVTGYTGDPNCTASELLAPPGYDGDSSDCAGVALLADGECTIANTLTRTPFVVTKVYSDGTTTTPVTVNLTCTSGTAEANDLPAAPGAPANFVVLGADALAVPTCTATETGVPAGFTPDITACAAVGLLDPGTCEITNNVTTGTFTVRKIYSDGEDIPVSVTATCTAPAVVSNNPQMASPSASAIFNVDYITDGVTTCTATEVVPDGYEADEADCQDGDPINGGCAITNTPIPRAEIQVLKDFTDDNPGEVNVVLDCNTGLILDQDKEISEDGIGVTFVVTDFTAGSLACNVKEVPIPNGYLADYEASGDDAGTDSDDDENGCYWADIGGGTLNVCTITNTPDEVDVVITKEWLYPGLSDNTSVSEDFSVVLVCDNATIDGGEQGYCGNAASIDAPSSISSNCKVLYGSGDDTITTGVTPGQFPGGTCYAVEVDVADIVEVDNGCATPMQISAGGGASCTITNTVFYEGIPTLNQYGMAIMALLMLGMGLVGFRRLT